MITIRRNNTEDINKSVKLAAGVLFEIVTATEDL